MLAVTIGVGPYEVLAGLAAAAVRRYTGLETVVLDRRHFSDSGLSHPHFLKLRLFDLIDADDILYFDADMVCLNKWNPRMFSQREAIVAVADRQNHPLIKQACATWGILPGEYFNTGLIIINRRHHYAWLKETESFIRSQPLMPLYDQTPLNIVRQKLGLAIELLDRRYNWIGFGEGSFCYTLPIFMAHTLCPTSKAANLEFFEGRLPLKLSPGLAIDEAETSRISGKCFQLSDELHKIGAILNPNGSIGPFDSPLWGCYWFVVRRHDTPVLIITSETEILRTYIKSGADEWIAHEVMREQGGRVVELTRNLISTKWFIYYRNGHERKLELLEGGQIGSGTSLEEQFWYVLEYEGEPQLLLGAGQRETSRLRYMPALGGWEGKSLIGDQAVLKMLPFQR